jgi:hypothetical protein
MYGETWLGVPAFFVSGMAEGLRSTP